MSDLYTLLNDARWAACNTPNENDPWSLEYATRIADSVFRYLAFHSGEFWAELPQDADEQAIEDRLASLGVQGGPGA